VTATFANGTGPIGVDPQLSPFVRDVEYDGGAAGAGWRALAMQEGGWTVPCTVSGCRLRYRFALEEAAKSLADVDTAWAADDIVVAPPSTWLLHPAAPDPPALFRFHVEQAPGVQFAAGTRPALESGPMTFEASTEDMDESAFAIFGSFRPANVVVRGSLVQLANATRASAVLDQAVVAWVRASVEALATYLGALPATRTLVIIVSGGRGPTRGKTLGDGGPTVLIRLGDAPESVDPHQDWVLTHELVHVNTPVLSRQHAWLEEGLATYIEPIVRTRASLISPEKFWSDLAAGLPDGLPGRGDEGLERTHTWGRTYWGGALYCLAADLRVRERTGNRHSLDDVLRAIAREGADVEVHWDIEEWLAKADLASGTRAFTELYRELALAPGAIDLAGMWARLGVVRVGTQIRFDDRAPLAAIRRAITAPR
jgi:hypothetical protein